MPRLTFVPPSEFAQVWTCAGEATAKAAAFADLARINALSMVMQAGSGHIGSSFSSLDLVSWVYLTRLDIYAEAPLAGTFFSSKGHDAPAVYSVLTATGRLPWSLVHRLRRIDGLPGHPDVATPWVEANTGSLGMGISKAKGMVFAQRLAQQPRPVYVLTGDGELQEGQNWEALAGAANRGLAELTVIVDHNKIQSDTWVRRVSDLGDIEAKFAAFGWAVRRCDGHDLVAVDAALRELEADPRPGVLIADTIKGRGVRAMEEFPDDGDLYAYHSGAPSTADYDAALSELLDGVGIRLNQLGLPTPLLEYVDMVERQPPFGLRMVDAWSEALVARAERDPRIVALDGDLVLDTGLVPFSKRFPDRFVECGIAEQDMVSQAGGMALRRLVPVVHSFASFLSGRPHEQVLTNSTERTKVIYVGSLAGIVPGGPGHSHQAVTDVASFGCVHDLVAVEPSHPDEIAGLLDHLLDDHLGSAYIRLVTPPVDLPFNWPDAPPQRGRGIQLRAGIEATLVAAGPIVLREAWLAADLLAAEGIRLEVIAMPWLNVVDDMWLAELANAGRPVLVAENHVASGGLGAMLLSRVALLGTGLPMAHAFVAEIPRSGTTDEVLRHHGLDAASLAGSVRRLCGSRA